MNRRRIGTSLYAGLLFTVLGVVAWVSGEPFIFPSLGPSAFVLAFERRGDRTRAARLVGSHLLGGVVGFFAYSLLATGVSITATPPPVSSGGLRLATSGVLSIVLTSGQKLRLLISMHTTVVRPVMAKQFLGLPPTG